MPSRLVGVGKIIVGRVGLGDGLIGLRLGKSAPLGRVWTDGQASWVSNRAVLAQIWRAVAGSRDIMRGWRFSDVQGAWVKVDSRDATGFGWVCFSEYEYPWSFAYITRMY